MHFQYLPNRAKEKSGLKRRKSRAFRRTGPMREELLHFAGIVQPGLRNGNSRYHLKMSEMLWGMDSSDIRRFKRRIKKGKEERLFPVEKIICSRGKAASRIAGFLGEKYVDRMVSLARSRGDVREVELGKKYLAWAEKNGKGMVKKRALAGMVMVASDEIEEKKGAYLGGQRAKRNGTMKLLKNKIGEEKTEKLVEKFSRGDRRSLRGLCMNWMLFGAAAASSMPAFQGYFSGQNSNAALLVLGTSALWGIVRGIGLLDSISIKRIQEKIPGKMNGHI
ncbi:MAG: hypothetical protein ACLFUZ_04640 [Candidatus Micrarchaeia archaeon]